MTKQEHELIIEMLTEQAKHIQLLYTFLHVKKIAVADYEIPLPWPSSASGIAPQSTLELQVREGYLEKAKSLGIAIEP